MSKEKVMPSPHSELQQAIDGLLETMDKASATIKRFTWATPLAIIGTMLAALVALSLSHNPTPAQAQIIIFVTVPYAPPAAK